MNIEMHSNYQPYLFSPAPAVTMTLSAPAPVEDEQRFRQNEQSALEQGRLVAASQGKLDKEWETLLPILHDIWSHFSQRGNDHTRGRKSPGEASLTWTQWLQTYYEQTGVRPQKVKRRLKAYRELIGNVPMKERNSSGTLNATEKNRFLRAILDAEQIARAIDEEEDPSEAVARFRSRGINFDGVRDALRRCPKPKGVDNFEKENVSFNQSTASEPGGSLRSATLGESLITLQPGDWFRLAYRISLAYRSPFNEVFASLSPEEREKTSLYFLNAVMEASLGTVGDEGGL
jgi:hypothetical protein